MIFEKNKIGIITIFITKKSEIISFKDGTSQLICNFETFPPKGVSISLSDGEPDVEERSFLLTNLPL